MVESFEEDFPSLKGKTRLNGDCGIDDAEIIINIFDLKNNCLDKERVRQACDNFIKRLNVPDDAYVPIEQFKEELGL